MVTNFLVFLYRGNRLRQPSSLGDRCKQRWLPIPTTEVAPMAATSISTKTSSSPARRCGRISPSRAVLVDAVIPFLLRANIDVEGPDQARHEARIAEEARISRVAGVWHRVVVGVVVVVEGFRRCFLLKNFRDGGRWSSTIEYCNCHVISPIVVRHRPSRSLIDEDESHLVDVRRPRGNVERK
jgi:hypothetical protein